VQQHQVNDGPLVSIGVPTFNRPDLLRRALTHLLSQSYRNIEVLISDNASTDVRVQDVIAQFSLQDDRIKSYIQSPGVSAYENFIFVLQQSAGEFFMWAADDDYIEPWFVERCLDKFQVVPNCALVVPEAQFFWEDSIFEFVPEGEAFRSPIGDDANGRIKNLLRHNYGNLIYGLYRRSALVDDQGVQWSRTLLSSPNEIAPLLLAANAGDIVALPDIGLFKHTPRSAYDQVVWENRGGKLPSGACLDPRSAIGTLKYHWHALQDINSAIEITGLPAIIKRRLRKLARNRLAIHFFWLMIGRKPSKPGV
tara:strand:- start:2216 stop:3142 length:927 start_codon:yes stop_codon:yes gene_type:complete